MQDADADHCDPASSSAQDAAAAGSHASAASIPFKGVDTGGLETVLPLPKSPFAGGSLASSQLAPSSPTSTRPLTFPHLAQVTGVDSFAAGAHSKLPPIPFVSGNAAGSTAGNAPDSREAGLRQLAILQSLVVRQTAALRDGLPPPPALDPRSHLTGPLSLPPIHVPPAPPPTAHLPTFASSSSTSSAADSMAPTAHHWMTNLDGLNHVPSGAPYPPLGNVTADELLAAQASLDLWSATGFNSNSPAGSPPVTQTGGEPSTFGPLPALAQQHLTPSSLDWSALYPHEAPTSHGLSPLPSFAHVSLHPSPPTLHHFLPSLNLSSFPTFPSSHNSSFSGPASTHLDHLAFAPPAPGPSSAQDDSSTGPSPTARRTSRANAGARGRAARAAAAASEGSDESGSAGTSPSASGVGYPGGAAELPPTYRTASGVIKPREAMTADEVEEDKRRRNTEASARFRAKKKMRDAQLQLSSASLRERVASLEKEKESLSNENRWLRDIVAEKAEVNPRLLDVLRQSTGD